jgi:hypothetical protein
MTKERGTSNIPMIMGIIGGVLGLPAAVCSAWCGEAIVAIENIDSGVVSDGSTGGTILLLGVLGAILGIVGGALGKKMPTPATIPNIAPRTPSKRIVPPVDPSLTTPLSIFSIATIASPHHAEQTAAGNPSTPPIIPIIIGIFDVPLSFVIFI